MEDTITKRDVSLGGMFVACIFENGVDDDLPGIAAMVGNLPVLVRDKVFKEGEPIVLLGAKLHLSCNMIEIDGEYLVDLPSQRHYYHQPVAGLRSGARRVLFDGCSFNFNLHRTLS